MLTRDFIYLDVERIRSLYSQIEQGVVESLTQEKGSEQKVEGKLEGGLPLIGKAGVASEALWKRKDSETCVLHDHMFNHVEMRLRKSKHFTDINTKYSVESWDRKKVSEELPSTAFIKAKGRVRLNDFAHMSNLMKDFHSIGKIIASFSALSDTEGKTKKQKAQVRRQAQENLGLPDKKLCDNLSEIIERFYGDGVVMKLWAIQGVSDCVFVSHLDKQYLRDSVDVLNFKFGTKPEDDWTILAQIARIPRIGTEETDYMSTSSDSLNEGIEGMFDASAELYDITSTKYPFILVTPLAIFRE